MRILSLLSIALITLACSRKSTETGYEIFPDMVHSVAYEAYSENPLTADKQTMMTPPAHTIARGKMPYHLKKGDADAIVAGETLVNPYKATKKNLARGKVVYENYCLACHGVTGDGDGPLIPKFPNPPSFHTKRLKKYPDGRIYHILVRGSGDMASHGEQIDRDDRWYLVHYINELQGDLKGKSNE